MLNTSQQIGGSLGTALLNTLFAGAVTAYLADHVRSAQDAQRLGPDALIHGYHVAFFWGAVLLACALVTSALLINAQEGRHPGRGRGGGLRSANQTAVPARRAGR